MTDTDRPSYKVLELLRRFGFHPLEGTVIPPKPVPVPVDKAAAKELLQPAGEPIPPVVPGTEAEK